MKRLAARAELIGECAYGSQVGEVELHSFDSGVRRQRQNSHGCVMCAIDGTACEDCVRALAGKLPRRFPSDPTIRAGDNDGLSRKIGHRLRSPHRSPTTPRAKISNPHSAESRASDQPITEPDWSRI